MRIFIASVCTETNTLTPIPTGRRAYGEGGLFRRDASRIGTGWPGTIARAMRGWSEELGLEVVESLFAFAQPSGPTLQSLWTEFRDAILSDLAAQPVDLVMLMLHGAMVSNGCEDCEGELLAAIRQKVGSRVPVGAMLDPHCHFTEAMRSSADVLIAMKEYPHTDGMERQREVLDLLLRQARGEIRPVTAVFDCRMIGFYPTTSEPMRGYVDRLKAVERRAGLLSVSVAHGFPWADVAGVGTRVWAITDNDPGLAAATAHELGQELYQMRDQLYLPIRTVAQALESLDDGDGGSEGLTVWADAGDNAGGGAPSDNTVILRALVERGISGAALGMLCDPVAVAVCFEAGVGESLDLRVGGKSGVSSGAPLDARVTVRGLLRSFIQPSIIGPQDAGDLAWVSIGGIDVVLCSIRGQTFSPEVFTAIGIDLARKKLAVVKSSQHFQAAFAPLASRVVHVAAGGALDMDFANFHYTRRDAHWWPRVADPLASH